MEKETIKFEVYYNSLNLINAILFAFVGVLFKNSETMEYWLPYIWWLGSIIWFSLYYRNFKYGVLIFQNNTLCVNRGIFLGIENITQGDIKNIECLPKKYIINLENGKKIKIYNSAINKKRLPSLENILRSFTT